MKKDNQRSILGMLGTVVSWILTAFFALMALAIPGVVSKVLFLICAVLPCPVFRKYVTIPKKTWIPAIAILFVAACVVSPTAQSSAEDPADPAPVIAEEEEPTELAETVPEEPTEQEAPIQEEEPAEVEEPVQEEQPIEPEEPAQEEPPAEPEEPAQEEQPVEPEASTPEEQPAEPEAPAQQEQPDEPSEAAASVDEPEESEEIIVYITNTGKKYHRGSCRHLKDSKIETTLEKAKSNGYEPCGTCNPPT